MTDAPGDAAVVTAPGRVALWRAAVCAPALALAVGAWGRWSCGAVDPMFVALGASLGLVAAALSFPEAVARRGALPRGLAWAMALALPGVVWAAAQAAYAERALALGPAAAIEDVHEGLWLALHDPLTAPIVVLWAAALAGSVLARTRRRGAWAATVVALGLAGGALLAREGAFDSHVLAGWSAVSAPQFALPSGVRRLELDEVPVGRSAGGEALAVALLLACLVPASTALADALRRRLGRADAEGEAGPPRRGLAAPLALVAATVLLLGWVGRRAPGAADVAWLIARSDRHAAAGRRVLARMDPDDPRAVGALAAALQDPAVSPRARRRAAELLESIGAAGPEPVAALAAAASELQAASPFQAGSEVSLAARRALVALGPRARAAGPVLLAAELQLAARSDAWSLGPWQELRDLQGAIGYEPSTAELLALCEHPDRGVVNSALRRLAALPSVDPAAAPALAPFLDERRSWLDRPAVVLVLARAGAGGLALLEERLRRPDAGRSWLPAALPGALPRTPAAWALLRVAADHEDERVRRSAYAAMATRVHGDPWPGSAELLLDHLDRDRSSTLPGVVASYGARVSPALSERLRDPARRGRALQVVARAGLAAHATAPALVEVLRACPDQRPAVIDALERVACPQNAPAFLEAADDPDPVVRVAAAARARPGRGGRRRARARLAGARRRGRRRPGVGRAGAGERGGPGPLARVARRGAAALARAGAAPVGRRAERARPRGGAHPGEGAAPRPRAAGASLAPSVTSSAATPRRGSPPGMLVRATSWSRSRARSTGARAGSGSG
ncbi:MAG: hypothetical protein KF878_32680 [Planctomycetes bacterium]|nr:hypothetical protein [Planctomycetota bacterium]